MDFLLADFQILTKPTLFDLGIAHYSNKQSPESQMLNTMYLFLTSLK